MNNRVLPKQKQYSTGEEILNSISHGAGAVFAACGTALLIVLAAFFSDAWGIVSSAVYGFSLIVLYTMSTLYHAITNERAKRVMRVLDHSSIFLLIAGTYTPISLVTLRGPLGWVVFGLVWGSAVIGIVFNAVNIERFKKLSLIFIYCVRLGGCYRSKADDCHYAPGRTLAFADRRAFLYGRHFFLRAEKAALVPRHLAPVCFIRKHCALSFYSVLYHSINKTHCISFF